MPLLWLPLLQLCHFSQTRPLFKQNAFKLNHFSSIDVLSIETRGKRDMWPRAHKTERLQVKLLSPSQTIISPSYISPFFFFFFFLTHSLS